MELASPITVYWDLPEAGAASLRGICEGIVACRPLMLQLFIPEGALPAAVDEVFPALDGAPVKVTVTAGAATLSSLAGVTYRPDAFLLAVDSLEGLKTQWPDVAAAAPGTGVAFRVNRGNWNEIPDLLTLCRRCGIGRIVFPMERLQPGDTPFHISRAEQAALSAAIAAAGGTDGLNTTIHDPFLWRAFHPDLPFPQGGCQAANTMIAIAADGAVFPCPTFPVAIGNVRERSLKDIVASPAKKEIRRGILKDPDGCHNCKELSVCRGGCRGRAFVAASGEAPDPACR